MGRCNLGIRRLNQKIQYKEATKITRELDGEVGTPRITSPHQSSDTQSHES